MNGGPFRILALDGGGSLGMYTLGVLSEVEKALPEPLHESFDLVYGTSTGSIIGSMIALGEGVDAIAGRYRDIVPDVMGRWFPAGRSRALERQAVEVYGDRRFDAFAMSVGIVATHLEYNRPMVFKNHVMRAHGGKASFEPGFGCTIAEAVVASCAAFPVFRKRTLSTVGSGTRTVVDGGFCANNPALFALTDATAAMDVGRHEIRLLSLGTGSYPERRRVTTKLLKTAAPTLATLLRTGSNTVEVLRQLLYPDVATVRIDKATTEERLRTDFVERDPKMLEAVYQLGRESFREREGEIRGLLTEVGEATGR